MRSGESCAGSWRLRFPETGKSRTLLSVTFHTDPGCASFVPATSNSSERYYNSRLLKTVAFRLFFCRFARAFSGKEAEKQRKGFAVPLISW